MVTIVVSVILIKPEVVLERVKYTFAFEDKSLARVGGVYLDYSSSARIFSWLDSINTWKKHPILGRGITGFAFLDGQYIRILPEMGIIGLFAFLWLLWTIYKNSLGIYKQMDDNDNLYKGLTLGFIAGFIGLAIHALTANTFILLRVMEPFWFIAGIIMMLPKVKEEEDIELERIEQKKKKEEAKKIKEEEKKEEKEKEEEEEGIGGGWHWDY